MVDILPSVLEEISGNMITTQEKRSAVPMDLRYGDSMDIMTDRGFSNMLFQVMNLLPGTGKFTAPVCATWIFVRPG